MRLRRHSPCLTAMQSFHQATARLRCRSALAGYARTCAGPGVSVGSALRLQLVAFRPQSARHVPSRCRSRRAQDDAGLPPRDAARRTRRRPRVFTDDVQHDVRGLGHDRGGAKTGPCARTPSQPYPHVGAAQHRHLPSALAGRARTCAGPGVSVGSALRLQLVAFRPQSARHVPSRCRSRRAQDDAGLPPRDAARRTRRRPRVFTDDVQHDVRGLGHDRGGAKTGPCARTPSQPYPHVGAAQHRHLPSALAGRARTCAGPEVSVGSALRLQLLGSQELDLSMLDAAQRRMIELVALSLRKERDRMGKLKQQLLGSNAAVTLRLARGNMLSPLTSSAEGLAQAARFQPLGHEMYFANGSIASAASGLARVSTDAAPTLLPQGDPPSELPPSRRSSHRSAHTRLALLQSESGNFSDSEGHHPSFGPPIPPLVGGASPPIRLPQPGATPVPLQPSSTPASNRLSAPPLDEGSAAPPPDRLWMTIPPTAPPRPLPSRARDSAAPPPPPPVTSGPSHPSVSARAAYAFDAAASALPAPLASAAGGTASGKRRRVELEEQVQAAGGPHFPLPSRAQQDDDWARLPRGDYAAPAQTVRRPADMPRGIPFIMAAFFQGRLSCAACGTAQVNWQVADGFDPARFMACSWCFDIAKLLS